MRMDYQVMEALEMLERERGIPVDTILDALATVERPLGRLRLAIDPLRL